MRCFLFTPFNWDFSYFSCICFSIRKVLGEVLILLWNCMTRSPCWVLTRKNEYIGQCHRMEWFAKIEKIPEFRIGPHVYHCRFLLLRPWTFCSIWLIIWSTRAVCFTNSGVMKFSYVKSNILTQSGIDRSGNWKPRILGESLVLVTCL